MRNTMVLILHGNRATPGKKASNDRYVLTWTHKGDPKSYPISKKLAKALIASGMTHGD